ncbi:MAG: signal recognition particle-docking protein FtsY [Acidimicrobiales bacterium]
MIAVLIVIAVVAALLLVAGGTLLVSRRAQRQIPPVTGSGIVGVARPEPELEAGPPEPELEAGPPEPELEAGPPEPELEAGPPEPELEAGPPGIASRIGKARGLLAGYLRAVRARSALDAAVWDGLEEALLRADVGMATTDALLADLRERARKGELAGPEEVLAALKDDMVSALGSVGDTGLSMADSGAVTVWLFVGVNGVGKTTSIGKIAQAQSDAGRSVLLAAGDTFRAAASEQLAAWAERAGVEVVRGAEGGDPSAVVYDAVQRAAARGNDLVLADTAGRLHTKVNLIEELKKIRRVADREPGRVTEVLLVLDATTGQNGLTQARQFTDAVGVTGVVLTKLDGTAKGGIVVAIQRELGLPVKLVGIGEGQRDLVRFDAAEFVEALLG